MSALDIQGRFNERSRCRDVDCIAVTPQESHAAGNPMSQRECAGFNWPPLSISAKQPVNTSPDAVRRMGPVMVA